MQKLYVELGCLLNSFFIDMCCFIQVQIFHRHGKASKTDILRFFLSILWKLSKVFKLKKASYVKIH